MIGVRDIQTDRLLLRGWRDSDREPFARINLDPVVMEFFPALLSAQESSALFDRIESHFDRHGFGLWAAELRETGDFIGYIGLAVPRFEAAFMPCVEIAGDSTRRTGAKDWPRKAREPWRATRSTRCTAMNWCHSPCHPTCARAA
jgi:hypothetical protein